jgi:hypothetical protein
MAEEPRQSRPLTGTRPASGVSLPGEAVGYRPPPAEAEAAERRGRIVTSEPARAAVAAAAVGDLAASVEHGVPLDGSTPAIFHALGHAAELSVIQTVEGLAAERAAAMTDLETARQEVADAEAAVEEARAAMEAGAAAIAAEDETPPDDETPREDETPPEDETAADVPPSDDDRPVGGTELTHPALPYLFAIPLVLFEAFFSTKVLQPVTNAGPEASVAIAGCLALVLTAALDGAARGVAGPLRRSRRAARRVLAITAVAAVAGVGWTTWAVNEARGPNIQYYDERHRPEQRRGLDFGPARSAADAKDRIQTPVAAPAPPKREGPDKPDARFALPATLTAFLLTFLTALRSGLAEDWRRAREAEEVAEEEERERLDARDAKQATFVSAHEAALKRRSRARAAEVAAGEPLEVNERDIAVAIRRERAFTAHQFARIPADIARLCGARGLAAPRFVIPDVPELAEVAYEIVDPRRDPPRERPAPAPPPPAAEEAPPDEPPAPEPTTERPWDARPADDAPASRDRERRGPAGWSTLGRRPSH